MFKYTAYVNLMCLKDPTDVIVVSVVMCLVILVIIALAIKLFMLSRVKIEKMTNPNEGMAWDKTYCYLSLWNLRLVQVSLVGIVI